MNKFTKDLGLNRSDEEIHATLERFAIKWQGKADRISRNGRD